LDLHGAPGGQTGNQDTGCDLGDDANAYFNTDWNRQLGVEAIDTMSKLCASYGSTCWGITLLNEPYGPGSDGLPRDALAAFYQSAIQAARQHLNSDTPIVIMDWSHWLQNYWKSEASSLFANAGKIMFSTHYFEGAAYDLQSAENTYIGDLNVARDFVSGSGFELIITEYYLCNHGDGSSSDPFPYGDMTRWLVDAFDEFAGSMVWNFDSYYSAWGPVDQADHVGNGVIPWNDIFSGSTPSVPTPSPSPSGRCCYGECGTSCQGGYCGQSQANCEGSCAGLWCPGRGGTGGDSQATVI